MATIPGRTVGVILGGGVGKRLYPLTRDRSKPAVPFGGKYRLIDIPISNCINSGIPRIAVLTQFNSVSLHRHITRTYNFDAFHSGWVQIWAAEQTPENTAWYQGTADAVRKQMLEIRSTRAEYVVILAGDHLYRMDYSEMARFHAENEAQITVAVQPVRTDDAARFGLLKRDPDCRITNFIEKPKDPEVLKEFVSRDDKKRPFLGSMGIYMFNTEVLLDLLENTTDDDFGGEVIPGAIDSHRIFGFDFDGYWEDIGTIRSFYETNLSLAQPNPPFQVNDPENPIYTRARFLPGSTIDGAKMKHVLLADGCRIARAKIRNSVIGLRSQVASGVEIRDSVLMGADYYTAPTPDAHPDMPLGIAQDCYIEGAILDKNVRIGPGVTIRPFPVGTEIDHDNWVVRDGIVVIPKNTILPEGTYIGPSD
ncbi:MAG: glucose-1-phosphate adenylyltransferase [Anaerolineales bacterium]|nr:glucose-1-phosphate adenylyltransferase [Anaerolineales bacterium]